MYLNDFDPNNPPDYDYLDECNRLLGIAIGRLLLAGFFLSLLGYDVTNGIFGLVDEPWYIKLLGAYAAIKIAWPILLGFELLLVDIHTSIREWRGTTS